MFVGIVVITNKATPKNSDLKLFVNMSESTLAEHVSVGQLQTFLTQAMERLGLPVEDAAIVGRLMAEAEAQGSDGHGAIRLLPYAKRIRAGGHHHGLKN